MTDTVFSEDFFTTVKSKVTPFSWAKQAMEKLIGQMSAKVDKAFDIPLLGGGWSHHYNCPNDGDRLQLIDRHHHKCPSCGSIWSGSPFDEVAVANEHWQYSIGCRDASILYGVTKESRWLEWAKRVLLFYADHYEEYPLHDKLGGQGKTSGKVQCQTLSESSWLIPLAQAFYLLKQQGVLSSSEIEQLTSRLFEPAIHVIRQNPAGTSNWQTYHNAAKAWTAAATNNRLLLDEALENPENGFYFQMQHSLGDDGFWYEGAWGYHFYTLEAQVLIVLAAGSFGLPLHENTRFRSMFRAPLACMLPDGTLPAVHDSGEVNVKRYTHLYEFSHSLWNEGCELISQSQRDSLYSLLFGIEGTTQSFQSLKQEAAWVTQDLTRAGMLFVKRGADKPESASSLMIDYGNHGGGHGHRDKLNLLYYAKGHPWLSDAGTVPYGNPLYNQYFKHTLPHNTIVIGGKSQAEAEGQLVYTRDKLNFFELMAEVDHTYPGTMLRRKLVITDEFILDIMQAECDENQTIDWVIQTQGRPIRDNDCGSYQGFPDDSLGTEDGYSYLRSIEQVQPLSAEWRMRWQWDLEEHQGDHFEIYGHCTPGAEELWIAESPALPAIKKRHAFIRRRFGVRSASFVTIFRACRAADTPLELQRDTDIIRIKGQDNHVYAFSTVI